LRTLGIITGALCTAALLAGCGKTYPVTAVAPTTPPLKPQVTSAYTLPTPPAAADPTGIASAPTDSNCVSGSIWFTEANGNAIGTLNEAAKFTTAPLPNANSEPYGITCGPDGEVWFTEYAGNRIGSFNITSEDITEYSIPTAGADPTRIAMGADNGLWFTETATGNIGRCDATTGTITEYSTGSSTSDPTDITLGSDGNLWFTLNATNQIGKITSGGTVTTYTVPTSNSHPYAIVSGSDADLWFTENATGKLGHVVPSNGAITEIALTSCANPQSLQQGNDGNFYIFCAGATPTVLQYVPSSGHQKSYAVRSGSVPLWSVIAFDGKLYFGDSGLNAIDQFTY
jgi:virginiamycin B lyase